MYPWEWGYYENMYYKKLFSGIPFNFTFYVQNYKEFEAEILDLQIEKYGLSFDIKNVLLSDEPWGMRMWLA